MDITELLAFRAKQGASDLHLSGGLPPMIRVDGDIRRINLPPMEHKQVHELIYDIMNDKQRKDYEEFLETDFSFEVPGVARFRVNAFNQQRGAAGVFRTIPSKVLSMEDLGMAQVFRDISMMPRGLVLVTGSTGWGKSTTLAAMVDFINHDTSAQPGFRYNSRADRFSLVAERSYVKGAQVCFLLATLRSSLARSSPLTLHPSLPRSLSISVAPLCLSLFLSLARS